MCDTRDGHTLTLDIRTDKVGNRSLRENISFVVIPFGTILIWLHIHMLCRNTFIESVYCAQMRANAHTTISSSYSIVDDDHLKWSWWWWRWWRWYMRFFFLIHTAILSIVLLKCDLDLFIKQMTTQSKECRKCVDKFSKGLWRAMCAPYKCSIHMASFTINYIIGKRIQQSVIRKSVLHPM